MCEHFQKVAVKRNISSGSEKEIFVARGEGEKKRHYTRKKRRKGTDRAKEVRWGSCTYAEESRHRAQLYKKRDRGKVWKKKGPPEERMSQRKVCEEGCVEAERGAVVDNEVGRVHQHTKRREQRSESVRPSTPPLKRAQKNLARPKNWGTTHHEERFKGRPEGGGTKYHV